MWLYFLLPLLYLGTVAARVVEHPASAVGILSGDLPKRVTEDLVRNSSRIALNDTLPVNKHARPSQYTAKQREDIWCKAKSKGMSLTQASILNELEARGYLEWPYVKSPWDGDLKKELKTWGYLDNDEDHKAYDHTCDFAEFHEMPNAFVGLNIDTRSFGMGGSNRCYHLKHGDGPAVRDEWGNFPRSVKDQIYKVGDKEYRVCHELVACTQLLV